MLPEAHQQKIVVIGDIHGHLEKLQSLWEHLLRHLGEEFDSYLIVFLGDFVDRGPKSREVIQWLIDLKARRPQTVCIAGNHEFAFMGYLGLLVDPATGSTNFRHTWEGADIYVKHGERELWYRGPGHETMHLQGRRWAAGRPDSIYNARSTCQSYGVDLGNALELRAAVPDEHKRFLQGLPWIHEIPGFKFVHAGLETEGYGYMSLSIDQQLQHLRLRTPLPRPEMLCGRETVFQTPRGLIDTNTCVISGHHGTVHFGPHRIVFDSSGGHRTGLLQALILPEFRTIDHQGLHDIVESPDVFPT
jgi:hypothetical protein